MMVDRSGDYSGSRWRGRVVNVMDPKKQGRVQVRLFGFQDNAALIPDKDLFWAIPKVPLTHGASFKGVGSSPVGVVPGSIVEGYFADSDKTILIADGTLPSAGTTKPGRIVDGSYDIDSATNDIARASRDQDLNAALGGKNLTALAAKGLKFASLSAGVGVLSSIPRNLISTMMQLDPYNMSGSLSGSIMAMSKIKAIDLFSSPAGLIDIGSGSITRALSSMMGSIGVNQTLTLVNSLNPATMSPDTLDATNIALGNISSAFQSGMPNPLDRLSAPAYNPSVISSSGPYVNSSQALKSKLSGISTISALGTLGGIDSLASIPGGITAGQALLSDIAVGSFISSGSITSGAGLAAGLGSIMNAVQLGGLNMLFGASLSSINQLAGIATGIVPQLSSLVNSVNTLTSIASAVSAFKDTISIPSITDELLTSMLGKLKSDALKMIPGDPPPLPEPSTTTDSTAATTPAVSTKPAAPTVGSADPAAFKALVGDEVVGGDQAFSSNTEVGDEVIGGDQAFLSNTEVGDEVVGGDQAFSSNPEVENEKIMKEIGAQQQVQQFQAEDVRATNVYGARFGAARNR